MKYFISAIGTDSGKTLLSAIMVEALNADYWKPVQAGNPTDTEEIRGLITNSYSKTHPEGIFLKTPASPHAAAKIENVKIKASEIVIPATKNKMIIEGAGGLLVPLNDDEYIVDLPRIWKIPIVLVSNLYLGSINHTLLTVEYLKNQKLEVKGIVFNGDTNPESENIILDKSGYKLLLKIPKLEIVNREAIRHLADEFLKNWNE